MPLPAAHAPILVFDSGVGGLSILPAIARTLPQAPLVYAMDGAAYPYGQRSDAELASRIPRLLKELASRFKPRLIVMACNTASTIALSRVRQLLDIPIVGTVPAIKPAAEQTRSGVIGILGTRATVRQSYVDELIAAHAGQCRVLRYGAPELVEYAQNHLQGWPCQPRSAPRQALQELWQQPGGDQLDTVVLACTHFPLVLSDLQKAACDPHLRFIDGASGIAAHCARLLEGQPWPRQPHSPLALSTGDITRCQALNSGLRRFGLAPVQAFG